MRINIYLHFPSGIETFFEVQETALKSLKDFQMIVDLADCEKDAELFCCKSDKDKFIEDIQTLEDLLGNIGVYDFETIINYLFLENGVKVVEENEIVTNSHYLTYNPSNDCINKEIPLVFKAAAQRCAGDRKHVIVNVFGLYIAPNPVPIIVNEARKKVRLENVSVVTNFKELDIWLQHNRLKRNFNKKDRRHIENSGDFRFMGKKTEEHKAPLLGGLGGIENAAKLLLGALGDKKVNEDLMNYDYDKKAYIWYEYENDNPQNQYHAYHLVIAFSHETNSDAIEKIPLRVRNLLKYRENL